MVRSRKRCFIWLLVLTLVCCAVAALLLIYLPCRHQRPEEWLAEVRSYVKDDVIIGDINVSQILLFPDPAFVPDIITELDKMPRSFGDLHYIEGKDWRALVGAIAACGGAEAATYLAQLYAEMEVKEHIEPSPPYRLPEHNEKFGREYREYPGWREARARSNDKEYVAFVRRGPSSGVDIYIGIDENSDGTIDNAFPTGLTDDVFGDTHMNTGDLPPKQPLGLSVVDGSITITHHQRVEPTEANRWKDDNKVVNSQLTMTALQKDSDNDGLTDICEACLLTNPHRKDTDGDGLIDLEDPHPLVDPSKMDRLERGLSRAFSYFSAGSMELNGPAPDVPYQSLHLYLEPPLEVAWATGPYIYGIMSPTPKGFWPDRFLLSKQEILDYNPREAEGLPSWHFSYLECRHAFRDVSEERIAYVVYMAQSTSGHLVVLVDVEGELYPALAMMTWIT